MNTSNQRTEFIQVHTATFAEILTVDASAIPGLLGPDEFFKVTIEIANRLMIANLGLSVRSSRALEWNHINTVEELVAIPLKKWKFRNFGEKCVVEILEKLTEKGVNLDRIPGAFIFLAKIKAGDCDVDKAQFRALDASDWRNIARVSTSWPEVMREVIHKLKKVENRPIVAKKLLRYNGFFNRTILYNLNLKFKAEGLPYRLKSTMVDPEIKDMREQMLQLCVLPS